MGVILYKIGELENGKDMVIDVLLIGNNVGGGILNINMNGEDNVRESEVGVNVVFNICIVELIVIFLYLCWVLVIDLLF